jgi:hypothetical protein
MTTTMTTTLTVPPVFETPATDSYTGLGRAGLTYLLTHGETSSWRLDDQALAAAADYASIACTAKGISVPAVERIMRVAEYLRGRLAARRAAYQASLEALRALVALDQGEEASAPPAASQGPAAGSQGGGGGAKVPRKPRPTPGAPAAGLPVPAYGIAPLALGSDAF